MVYEMVQHIAVALSNQLQNDQPRLKKENMWKLLHICESKTGWL